jgi:acetoin utilization deacetylase AcuC-like enzyme
MKKNASYYIDFKTGDFFYANQHPMKPVRIAMVHDLVISYGLHKYLNLKFYGKSTKRGLLNFHISKLIDNLYNESKQKKILSDIILENVNNIESKVDCPIFRGVMEYCELYSGASISAASALIKKESNIVINWSGGLHHAKKSQLSGFCYINDIVLLILELLRYFSKIFYIDIDVHHGDGVEEAFYLSNRVISLSFHNYDGIYFPSTGNFSNKGKGKGKYYSINVPLKPGIDDGSFESIFKPIVNEVIENFKPNVIVFQCGADSLFGDNLGLFNLSINTHGNCIRFVKNFFLPMVILGGGGYNKKNVAECWTFETSILLNKEISLEIPYNSYWGDFYSEKKNPTHLLLKRNRNSKRSLDILKNKILDNIKKIK